MNDSHRKSRKVSPQKKLRARSLALVGAIALVILGGIITWAILETVNPPGSNEASDVSKQKEPAPELVELAKWDVALGLPVGSVEEDVVVTPVMPSAIDSVIPDAYRLSTKASQDNAKLCGLDDDSLMVLTRTKSSPTLSDGEVMAGTSKIGDYYYVYRFTTTVASEADCPAEVRAELAEQRRFLERIISNIQLQ